MITTYAALQSLSSSPAESDAVMAASTATTTDTAPTAPPPPASSAVAETAEAFIQMLVAQIQYQDPTDPLDSSQMVTQLTSMVNTIAVQIQTGISVQNQVLLSNIQLLALGNMVGSEVWVQSSQLEIGSEPIECRLTLQHPSQTTTVTLTAADGTTTTIDLGPQEAGQVSFTIDPAALGLPPGEYTMTVTTDTGETEIPIEVAGTLESVRVPLDGSATLMKVSGVGEVPFYMITQFDAPPAEEAPPVDGGDPIEA